MTTGGAKLHSSIDEEKLLGSVDRRRKARAETTEKLGTEIETFLQTRRSQFSKNISVVDLWEEILPEDFREHCALAEISGGVLQLEVDPGPYMHELKLLSDDLLSQFQMRCPRAGIKKISLRPRKKSNLEVEEER